MLLVFEEEDPLNDLSVSASNNLGSQLLWQVLEKLVLLSKTVILLLIIFKMSLDLPEHAVRHLGPELELLEDRHLLGKLLILGVHRGDHTGHVSNGIGVESHSNDHPQNGEDSLRCGLYANISETHGS